MASSDREKGGRDPFRPGRFTGRNRKGHRRLDGNVLLMEPRERHVPFSERLFGPLQGLILARSNAFPFARWAPIPLRVIVGYGFMEHGFAKLPRGPEAFARILQTIGVPDPHLMSRVTILIEVFGGLAVLLGALVEIVTLPMVALLMVATFSVQLPYGFSSVKLLAVTASGAKFGPVRYEVNLLYLACLATLVLGGPGPFALDRVIIKRGWTPNALLRK